MPALGSTHFDLALQATFIQAHGEQVWVSPALQCPCLLDDQQFNPVCTTCHGTGRFYPPGTAFVTWLLMVFFRSRVHGIPVIVCGVWP